MRNINHIIEELGFKHQWCYFHAIKNFNKIIKKHIKENELTDDDIDKIQKEKLELFSLFGSENTTTPKNPNA